MRYQSLLPLFVASLTLLGTNLAGATEPPETPPETATLRLSELDTIPKSWGTAFKGTIRSSVLGEERTVNIYLPESFAKTNRSFPVIFLTDGEYYFEPAALASRQLYLAGHIPECIVAAIETPIRRQDLTPPGMSPAHSDGGEARGEKLLRFISDELRPQLEARFRAGPPAVLMGHSHGGILCHYAAAKWRSQFPFIVSLDAPMHLDNDWLADTLIDSIPAGGRLRLVSIEVKFGWSDTEWGRLESAAPKDWLLVRRALKGEDHESMVFAGFWEGLKEIFSDFSRVRVKGMESREAFRYYQRLASSYGASPTPPEYVIRRALMEFTALGMAADARIALDALINGYGETKEHDQIIREIDEAAAALKGQETVDQLLASPAPTAAELAPYLGVWRGSSWLDLDENRKQPLIVTFSIKDGRGLATAVHPDAPEEYRNETYKYLRVTPEGIEFGSKNGMFPPGVIAHVSRLHDGRLEGEAVFKGVYFVPPPGVTMPHHMFSIARDEQTQPTGK